MPDDWSLRRRITLSEGEVAYDILGFGPPLILVHGTPTRSYIWRDVVLGLAGREGDALSHVPVFRHHRTLPLRPTIWTNCTIICL